MTRKTVGHIELVWRFTYRIRELEAFLDFQPGSQWTLRVNGFGDLVGVEQ